MVKASAPKFLLVGLVSKMIRLARLYVRSLYGFEAPLGPISLMARIRMVYEVSIVSGSPLPLSELMVKSPVVWLLVFHVAPSSVLYSTAVMGAPLLLPSTDLTSNPVVLEAMETIVGVLGMPAGKLRRIALAAPAPIMVMALTLTW